ncbi:unnamed protein product [Paramecium primaurelia]|uniref:Uncharacterized protein n=1 Tax=Paramecium primaurelia TaxID=5886 RepID=A0A8S1Q0Z4_PARPR|nr:unnamed protein product [Paramecium primaurelia]
MRKGQDLCDNYWEYQIYLKNNLRKQNVIQEGLYKDGKKLVHQILFRIITI